MNENYYFKYYTSGTGVQDNIPLKKNVCFLFVLLMVFILFFHDENFFPICIES